MAGCCDDALYQLKHHQFLLELVFDIYESLRSNSNIQPYSFDDLIVLVDIYQRHNQEAIFNLEATLQNLRKTLSS